MEEGYQLQRGPLWAQKESEYLILSYDAEGDQPRLNRFSLMILREDEADLRSGRFEHYKPDWLSFDCSFEVTNRFLSNHRDFFEQALNALHVMERPWSFRMVRIPKGWRYTFGLQSERDAVELKLRMP